MSGSNESGLGTIPSRSKCGESTLAGDNLEHGGIHPFFEEDTWRPDLPDNVTDVVTVLADLVEVSLKSESEKGQP